jgi:hypothetical protein
MLANNTVSGELAVLGPQLMSTFWPDWPSFSLSHLRLFAVKVLGPCLEPTDHWFTLHAGQSSRTLWFASAAGLSAMIIGRLFVIAGCLRASVMYPVLLVLDELASTN